MKKTSIGQMKHLITILKQIRISDDQGGYKEMWQNAGIVWASIEPVSGKEYYEAMQLTNDITHKVRMRYTSITPHNRIKYNNRIFEIIAVIDINMEHKELEVLCREQAIFAQGAIVWPHAEVDQPVNIGANTNSVSTNVSITLS